MKLSRDNRRNRVRACRRLLKRFSKSAVSSIVFTDEKLFTLETPLNPQNDRVYAKEQKKKDVPEERLIRERSHFSKKVMVSVGVSKEGKTGVHFIEEGAKINSDVYQQLLSTKLLPDCRAIFEDGDYVLQQDGAPAHRSKSTVSYLEENVPDFIGPKDWPANSPDLNPVDYCVWGRLQELVYKVPIRDIAHLKERIVQSWESLSNDSFGVAIDRWLVRLRKVVANDGGHIEHEL